MKRKQQEKSVSFSNLKSKDYKKPYKVTTPLDKVEIKEDHKNNKGLLVVAILLMAIVLGVLFYNPYNDIEIEIGSNQVTAADFCSLIFISNNTNIITPEKEIKLNKLGEYDVQLQLLFIKKNAKVFVVDTQAPELVLKNIATIAGYKTDINDFVDSVTDKTKVTLSFGEDVKDVYDEYGYYEIEVIAEDEAGNISKATTVLNISIIKSEIVVELGSKITAIDLATSEDSIQYINSEIVKEINNLNVGSKEIVVEYNNYQFTCLVNVVDTTGPVLKLRNISKYTFENIANLKNESFLVECWDHSGEYTIEYLNNIDFTKLGTQTLKVKATDEYGNETIDTCTYTYKYDDVAPNFTGLSDMEIAKNSSPDYKKGVKAIDNGDGEVSFTYDASKVDVSKAGTYYVVYTAVDSRGNKATNKRKVTVAHDAADTQALFDEFFEQNLKGKSIVEVVTTIRNKIRYNTNWGGSDPVWYGLTNKAGNCYVHAWMVKKAMDKMGYNNMIIGTTDKWHYWNLIYSNGKWAHYDSTITHSIGPDTDEQKWNASDMLGHTWDKEKYPAAN